MTDYISLYFDLDEASQAPDPNSEESTWWCDGELIVDIPGFTPITTPKEDPMTQEIDLTDLEENFAGGFGPYVFPWSAGAMLESAETIELEEQQRNQEADYEIMVQLNATFLEINSINWKKKAKELFDFM
ncbi:uncharacterized protein F4822DRAFT_152879 [Hypoxylon trugodes]|uniref:uncharacterized protein n=1 Tax=Hypoxylon trugodes TaxID=326681 RepID=UPI00219EB22D|nr:uncharacterized protein F4822DRAFT_152879 [Hypoxylon trugodes]KAI1390511.1 hypothetical protein F4822DRAFT_152879 [Hypoxylon trugodes]